MYGYGDILCGIVIGVVVGVFIGGGLVAMVTPSDYQKDTIICQYMGGEQREELCIRDKQVIDAKFKR